MSNQKRGLRMAYFGIFPAILMFQCPAAAQEPAPGGDPLAELAACSLIAEADLRLACFDREYAAFEKARQEKRVAVVNRSEIRETRRALFGLSLPKLRLFDRDEENEEDQTFAGTVRSVSAMRGGRYLIQVDDSVWQTTETGYFQTPPKIGAPAEIKRGILGSYRLSIDGKAGLKAVRVR